MLVVCQWQTNGDRCLQIFSKEIFCESEAYHPTVCSPGFLPVSHIKKIDFFFLSFQPCFWFNQWQLKPYYNSWKCGYMSLVLSARQPLKGSHREELERGEKEEVCMWREGEGGKKKKTRRETKGLEISCCPRSQNIVCLVTIYNKGGQCPRNEVTRQNAGFRLNLNSK